MTSIRRGFPQRTQFQPNLLEGFDADHVLFREMRVTESRARRQIWQPADSPTIMQSFLPQSGDFSMRKLFSLLTATLLGLVCWTVLAGTPPLPDASPVPTSTPSQRELPSMINLQTSLGVIGIELDHERAPATAANFVQYVQDGFYNGTLFHRVIPDFMIQGGGMEPGMNQKQTRASIRNEAENGLKNVVGSIAMARTSDPHSASSQFFINLKNNDFLDYRASNSQGWGYCVFGKVVKGMDVVEAIARVSTANKHGHQNVPVDDVVIIKADISGEQAEAPK
ncbi:MAG: peptidyl-prolyl cis-trans isomerase [Pseudomonadota bacterium]|nr:peptidyl-prolyl cis-trans isomerase [Pseudomonadota bacterium]